MKVLFLSTWYPYPPNNGSKIRAYSLINALERAHQVTLVAFKPADTPDNDALHPAGPNTTVHAVPVDPYRFVSCPGPVKFLSPVPVAFWESRAMRQTVARLAAAERWDIVVAYEMPVAQYALELQSVPRILEVDTALSFQMYERYCRQAGTASRLRAWVSWQKAHRYERRMLRRFDAFTVASAAEVDYLSAMVEPSRRQHEVVPNGMDCVRNQPGMAQPAPRTLIYNGALTYSANYDAMRYFLDEIYPRIQERIPDVQLTITGSTSGVDLDGLQHDGSVHFSGYVDDIRPLVAGASVCVVPLRQGSGTRLKILESMALGTPLVATYKGAEGLILKDGEHLLLADDPAVFAERVVQLLCDDALRTRLVHNARRLVEQQYDWEQIARRFAEMVERVAHERARDGATL